MRKISSNIGCLVSLGLGLAVLSMGCAEEEPDLLFDGTDDEVVGDDTESEHDTGSGIDTETETESETETETDSGSGTDTETETESETETETDTAEPPVCVGDPATGDFDGDGVCDDSDVCPRSSVDSCAMLEDFENTVDGWPWTPWVRSSAGSLEDVAPGSAHDGSGGLGTISSWIYRTDTSFGTVENEVLSAWCHTGANMGERCTLGFGSDAASSYGLKIGSSTDEIEFFFQSDYSTTFQTLTKLATVPAAIEPDSWYLLEIHVRAGGVLDGQVYASDGLTPLGSVQHDFGPLPFTGVALTGTIGASFDTIRTYLSDGHCIDMDADGVCDGDDLCVGDDATGDDDTDGICNENDVCTGLDMLGDGDGDGFCDEAELDTDVPPFYDQSVSEQGWAAGGACVEKFGVAGLPACSQTEWQKYTNDINYILATYDWTNAIFDAATGGGQSHSQNLHKFSCGGFSSDPANVHMFDDLNSMYHATADDLFSGAIVDIDFQWAVNIWYLLPIYDARAQIFGGLCELDAISGAPMGFHAADLGSPPWIEWTVKSTEDCDMDGCRCEGTLTLWSDLDGTYLGENIVFDNKTLGSPGSETSCSDSRFLP